jgi:hypothetical protein
VSAELLSPKSHGLVRDDDATSCQQILDHPQAERKSEIQPNGMGNHLPWKSVATIKRITAKSGHHTRSHIFIDARLTLRCRLMCSSLRRASIARADFSKSSESSKSNMVSLPSETTWTEYWAFFRLRKIWRTQKFRPSRYGRGAMACLAPAPDWRPRQYVKLDCSGNESFPRSPSKSACSEVAGPFASLPLAHEIQSYSFFLRQSLGEIYGETLFAILLTKNSHPVRGQFSDPRLSLRIGYTQ